MAEFHPPNSGQGPLGRIAFILPDLSGGGAERVTLDLARGFLNRGYSCDLVLYRFSGSYTDQVPKGLNLVDLKASRTISALVPLTRYLRQNKPQAFISALIHTNLIATWAAALSRTRPRLILTFHSMTSDELLSYTNPLTFGLTSWLMRRTYPRAHNLVAVSNGAARDLEKIAQLPQGRVKTIYNPCDLEKIRAKAATDPDHPWFRPGQPPVVLALGRMVDHKDFPTLINAVSVLRRERPVRLMILGEGPDREALIRLSRDLGLGDDFAAPGFTDNPFAYMAAASVVAMTSRYEGFGLVLVEAMALGTPVVSTDCPFGPAEVLDNGKYGQLVPMGDPQTLAKALAQTLADPVPALELISRADEFSLEKALDQYQTLFTHSPG